MNSSLFLPLVVLVKLWPHASPALRQGIAQSSEDVFAKYGINTMEDVREFMATISEETGGGLSLRESGNYSAERAHEVWPSIFRTADEARPFVGDGGKKLFNHVYGDVLAHELGNTSPEDGWNFRGGGLIQITGRTWYEKIGKATNEPLVDHPELVADPATALECAAAFWNMDDVNTIASAGEFLQVTKKVNGGTTNMAQRLAWLKLWEDNYTEAALDAANTPQPDTLGLKAATPVKGLEPLPSYVTTEAPIYHETTTPPAMRRDDLHIAMDSLPIPSIIHPTFWAEMSAFLRRWSR